MKAVVYTRYGPPGLRRLTDVAMPVPHGQRGADRGALRYSPQRLRLRGVAGANCCVPDGEDRRITSSAAGSRVIRSRWRGPSAAA